MVVIAKAHTLEKRTAIITMEYYSRASLAKDHDELRIRLETPAIGHVSGVNVLNIINSQSLLDELKKKRSGEKDG